MNRCLKIAGSMLDLIGEIPLVRLNRIGRETGAEFLVKPEYLNPSGSMKDRVAARMIEDAERAEHLRPGDRIAESSTGNTGAALAFVSAVKGYRFTAFVPGDVAEPCRLSIMQAYGAETVPFSPEGEFGALAGRKACLDGERRGEFWWARQFANQSAVAAHGDTTAREILQKTDGNLQAFVASAGSGGTLLGVAQVLKQHDPRIHVMAVEPSGSPELMSDNATVRTELSGGILADLVESRLVDEVVTLDDETAIQMANRLAREEGMFCGISSGANVAASVLLADRLGPGCRIVTCLCDSRDRYFNREAYIV